ncbi:DUF1285 domain-containing protein [Pseudooceanicola aestuarii]|uniref:DUF1285 domain-containing protein n=1 Tax=Pseudooceanicola aestuarii TaxID=2697319 RepID=UPI001EF853C9|nr:DUF1285 domain-containing protein [Pseudooceanicola aestuarii]
MKVSAKSIEASAKAAQGRGLPPIHKWNPEFRGNLDMRIARDGTWYHEGRPIARPELVRLFSTILKKEGADYVLVTPVEKVGITVEDAPFVAVDVEVQGQGPEQVLTFLTNVADHATAGPENPIRVTRDSTSGEPSPYVLVRDALEALIDRKSFYRLVNLGVHETWEGRSWFGLWSGGAFFPIIPSEDLTDS